METNLKLLQLRGLLAERFPGLKMRIEEKSAKHRPAWPTGLSQCDNILNGGLPKGAITELVGKNSGSGTALLIQALMHQAQESNQFVALIDGKDSFDPTALDPAVLSRLLWIRCHNAAEAMKCADILLRDRNLPLVILDLRLNPTKELRRISGTPWYRLQRIIEQTATAFLVVTPHALVSGAEVRLVLNNRFSLADMDRNPAELLAQLNPELERERASVENVKQSA